MALDIDRASSAWACARMGRKLAVTKCVLDSTILSSGILEHLRL